MSDSHTLILGLGNTLRGDDGLGPWITRKIADVGLPGVEARAVQELGPEMALELALKKRVVFVDAYASSPVRHGMVFRPLIAKPPTSVRGHYLQPEHLLSLAEQITRAPIASWLLAIPGAVFGFQEKFSLDGERQGQNAFEFLLRWLTEVPLGSTV